MRRKLLLGNWKMNKTMAEAKEFAIASVRLSSIAREKGIDIGVAPTFLSLTTVKALNPDLIVAAQTCHYEDKGAFTGEISVPMLKEIGIDWVLIGHSERRTYNNETNLSCNKKLHKLVDSKMIPVYCVGETLSEFEDGRTKDIVETQLRVGMGDIPLDKVKAIIIAYEPVWSIGTGKNASTEIAEDVCLFIRQTVRGLFG
ncbi:MAG: triose-phosphate isomerase, partial [Firmicutes bacterium]|nr:triose-phosphate isomerase [Bacillota bacterium]